METRYEIEPERVGRATDRRRPMLAVVIGLVVVAVVVVKPWAGPETPRTAVGPTSAPPFTDPSPAGSVVAPGLDPDPIAIRPPVAPTWPAAPAPTTLATQTAHEAEGALLAVARHAGTWGVGSAGVGPRMLRDEPWSDWAPVAVEVVDGAPVHIASWPDTDICAGYPTIYDRPTIVAVTTPRNVAPDWRLVGWWTNGAKVAALDGSIVQISPFGSHGIGYLERVDQAPWPPGRYEFHVVTDSTSVSLTVCLTRRG